MLIRDRDFLAKAENKGDNIVLTHAQNVTDVLWEAHRLRNDGTNGWSDCKGFRRIAHIPALDAARLEGERPGIFQDVTGTMITDWLKKEGEPYLTVNKSTL